jgi:hypothetical protein
MTNQDQQLNRQLESYRRKSLADLERQYRGLKQKGIPDAEREIGLLEAQIEGLLKRRPEGFGPRVEQLKDQADKLKTSLESVQQILAALETVIAEKQAEL